MAVASAAVAACERREGQNEVSARPTGTVLSRQDLEDALVGSSYLGCGGGGSLAEARRLIAADLDAGRDFRLIDVSALADTDRVACPYALESLAPMSDAMAARLEAMGGPQADPVLAAFRALETHLGAPFAGVILGEIGPLSMAEGLSTAARLGVPALDADTVGRATPEINQHSVRVAGHDLTPSAAVTLFGDELILKGVRDPSREEDVFRALSVASRLVGVADAPITGAIAKSERALVKNSFSLARSIGAAVRSAKDAGTDPIAAARDAGDGFLLFEGQIDDFDWRDADGFLVGDVTLAGVSAFNGSRLVLQFKNEHLVARRDDRVIATCPDLITMIDASTAGGVNNPDFERGRRVSVLGFRCHAIWRRPEGLNVFSPRYFGYDLDYVPIEALAG